MTLVEVLVSLTLLVSLVIGTFAIYSFVLKSTQRNEASARLDADSQYLTEYLASKIEGIGGGATRPWAAIWVEDQCASRGGLPDCAGSDRLSIAEIDNTLPECDILDFPAANQIHVASVSGTCCLTAAYQNRQVVVNQGPFHIQQYLTNVQTGPCTADISSGQAGAGINNPPGALAQWAGGRMSVVKLTTYFRDAATSELKSFVDANNDVVLDAGEVSVLADHLVDLQFALGFDSNPRDGKITDSGDQNDEWLYNITHAQEALGAGGLTGADKRDFRMVAIGITLGMTAPDVSQAPVSILNGLGYTIPGKQLRKSLARVRVRSLDLFLAGG